MDSLFKNENNYTYNTEEFQAENLGIDYAKYKETSIKFLKEGMQFIDRVIDYAGCIETGNGCYETVLKTLLDLIDNTMAENNISGPYLSEVINFGVIPSSSTVGKQKIYFGEEEVNCKTEHSEILCKNIFNFLMNDLSYEAMCAFKEEYFFGYKIVSTEDEYRVATYLAYDDIKDYELGLFQDGSNTAVYKIVHVKDCLAMSIKVDFEITRQIVLLEDAFDSSKSCEEDGEYNINHCDECDKECAFKPNNSDDIDNLFGEETLDNPFEGIDITNEENIFESKAGTESKNLAVEKIAGTNEYVLRNISDTLVIIENVDWNPEFYSKKIIDSVIYMDEEDKYSRNAGLLLIGVGDYFILSHEELVELALLPEINMVFNNGVLDLKDEEDTREFLRFDNKYAEKSFEEDFASQYEFKRTSKEM